MTAGELTPGRLRLRMALRVPPRDGALRRRLSSKCLFGRPDREDTTRMVAEQLSQDRRRMIERFGFDIRTEAAYNAPKCEPYEVCDKNKNDILPRDKTKSEIFTQTEFAIYMDEDDKENTPVKKMAQLFSGDNCGYRSPKRTKKEGTPRKRSNSKGISSLKGTPSKKSPHTPPRAPLTPTRAPQTPSKRTPLPPSKWAPLTPRQLHMTDYWNVRKRSESTSSDKEN